MGKKCKGKKKDCIWERTAAQRSLSAETLAGLKMTGKVLKLYLATSNQNLFVPVNAFVELTKYLLQLPRDKFILLERFCQDPVEWTAKICGRAL